MKEGEAIDKAEKEKKKEKKEKKCGLCLRRSLPSPECHRGGLCVTPVSPTDRARFLMHPACRREKGKDKEKEKKPKKEKKKGDDADAEEKDEQSSGESAGVRVHASLTSPPSIIRFWRFAPLRSSCADRICAVSVQRLNARSCLLHPPGRRRR